MTPLQLALVRLLDAYAFALGILDDRERDMLRLVVGARIARDTAMAIDTEWGRAA